MYENDFFLTWDKTDDEIEAVFTVADALRYMREHNISTKIFESGLGISLFRDNSTRTRFSLKFRAFSLSIYFCRVASMILFSFSNFVCRAGRLGPPHIHFFETARRGRRALQAII